VNPEELMQLTISRAAENACAGNGGPFAALIVRNGTVVAEGTNLVTSSRDATAHAEIVAIRRGCSALGSFELSGCEIYTSCEPCPMCLGAIYWARLSAVYYSATHKDASAAGFDDSLIYQQMCTDIQDRAIPMRRLLAENARDPFVEWMNNASRIPY
jgi:guanine deaminase